MKVACAPDSVTVPAGQNARFQLFNKRVVASEGEVAATMLEAIGRAGIAPDQRAWDFLSIALSVIAADESCPRNSSGDGWTRTIELTVAVSNPKAWTKHLPKLEHALGFLSTDRWKITLINGGIFPKPKDPQSRPEDCVSLLSGGLDSLIGALDLKANGFSPLLVSQTAKGDKAKQKELAALVAGNHLHLQLNHNAKPPSGFSERSQRSRSIIFIAYAVLAATSLDKYKNGEAVDIYIPENGFISLNVPLTPLRMASHSTRTTHPYYIGVLQEVFSAVGFKVNLLNPYQFKTKGEMLAECKDQKRLKIYAGSTTSCGRFARNAFKHCGRCVPCQIRRAAFQSWGSDSTAQYKYDKLGINDSNHSGFDDVRSVGMAIDVVTRRGLDEWIGSGLGMVPLNDRAQYAAVLDHGIKELNAFHRKAGVK
ncbi:MAG: Qat anti-phage system QueC-like protein QatC [Hyphomicrobiaceae bacterium]